MVAKNMTNLSFATSALSMALLISLSSGRAANAQEIKLVSGKTYKYYSDGSCATKDNDICLSRNDYTSVCKSAKGVTNNAIKVRAVLASRDEKALLEGGTFESINVVWGDTKCFAFVTVSGIVDGTSKRLTIQGIASSFIVNSEGTILVSYFNF